MVDRYPHSDDPQAPQALNLQAFTYFERTEVLPEVGCAIDNAGGWMLDRRPLSASVMELQIEVQMLALPEIYAALLTSGLELTREGHRALTERCNCTLHMPPRTGMGSILSLRVELHFLTDVIPPGFC